MLKKQIALGLTVLLLLALLPSCSLFSDVKIENGRPVAVHFKNEEAVNAEIQSFFGEIDRLMAEGGVEAELVCTAEKTDGGFLISSQIKRGEAAVDLPDLNVRADGTVQKPGEAQFAFVRDGDFTDGALRLEACGIDVFPSEYSRTLNIEDMYAFAQMYYDSFGADDGVPKDLPLDEKMHKLGISNRAGETQDGEAVDDYSAAVLIRNMQKTILSNAYGYSSDEIKSDCFLDTCELLFDVNAYFKTELTDVYAQFLRDARAYLSEKELLGCEATRFSVAEACVGAYEKQFTPLKKSEIHAVFPDTKSLAARKAVSYAMMINVPRLSNTFCGDYVIHSGEAAETAFNIADTVKSAYAAENGAEYKQCELTYGGQVAAMGMLDEYLSGFTKHEDAPVYADNGGDNSWYVSQLDNSEYAEINCMPSIASMGIRWYFGESDVTPAYLREKYGDGTYSGWYMYQVLECLDDYGVPYTQNPTVSLDEMTAALDRGSIILTQMSEASPGDDGHCLVIYGYRKYGDSLIFTVNDSYGDEGKGKKMDSAYAEFIITRFAGEFIEISK